MENMDVINISTLGDLIKFHRNKKEFTIDELSKKTKIRIRQLINLEENKLNELPSRVYLVGFLKTLCNELEMNFDLALKFLNESNIKEGVLEFLPLGKEIKPIHFKFLEKSSGNKILLPLIFIFGFSVVAVSIGLLKNKDDILQYMNQRVPPNVSIIPTKQLVQSDIVIPEGVVVSDEILLPAENFSSKEQSIIANSEMDKKIEEKTVPLMQQLTITATGTAFLAYRLDKNPLVKLFLTKGKTLDLKGQQIRLDAGNPDVLEFSKNGEVLKIEKNTSNSKVHLVFPEEQQTQQVQTMNNI